MARPDTDDGWFKMSDELFAAICLADFPKRCMVILREVFEQIFGDDKHSDARIDPADIAVRSGLDRASAWRGVRELVTSGVLVHAEGYRYRFVKDYSRWTRKGQPRINAHGGVYCRDAPERAHPRRRRRPSHMPRNQSTATDAALPDSNAASTPVQSTATDAALPDSNGEPRDPLLTSNGEPRDPLLTSNGEPRDPLLTSNAGTIEDRARQRESENLRSENSESVCVSHAHVRDSNGEPISLESGITPDPDELSQVSKHADQLFPMMSFSTQVHAFSHTYPLAWIRQALDDARNWTSPPRSFKPIWNRLQEWARQGGPPALVAIPFAGTPAAPAKVDRAQAKVDEFRRYMAAKAAKAAASKEASS